MSRTWNFLSVKRPDRIPFTETIICEKSVVSLSAREEFERSGKLHFVIGPTFIGAPMVKRKLTFSYDEKPELDYEHDLAGEIEPGEITSEERKIYLFLEK